MTNPTYPTASTADPVTPADLRCILDTHGLRFPEAEGGGEEVQELHRLYRHWINQQGIQPNLVYVIPLDVMFSLLADSHGGRRNERGSYAWRLLTDASNDPHGGLQIVKRRYSCRSAA